MLPCSNWQMPSVNRQRVLRLRNSLITLLYKLCSLHYDRHHEQPISPNISLCEIFTAVFYFSSQICHGLTLDMRYKREKTLSFSRFATQQGEISLLIFFSIKLSNLWIVIRSRVAVTTVFIFFFYVN